MPNTFKVYDVVTAESIKTISMTAQEFCNDEQLLEKLSSEGIHLDPTVTKVQLADNGLALKIYSGNQLTLTIEEW